MNEVFETLGKKFPFLSLIRKGSLEFIGIISNQDNQITSVYDYGRIMSPKDKMDYLRLGEVWWWQSNRKIPINIFLKGDWTYFRSTLISLATKDIQIVHGPCLILSDIAKKRIKRRTIQLVRRPV